MSGTTNAPDWSAIPAPVDDGAARHLPGVPIAKVELPATSGAQIDLSAMPGRVVVFAFPRTSRPGVANPAGWDLIPGAREVVEVDGAKLFFPEERPGDLVPHLGQHWGR